MKGAEIVAREGMKTMLKTVLLASAIAMTATATFAQMAPPMDMSWAIQSQMRNQMLGDQRASYAAMWYYNTMMRLRAMGYTGPSLPTGVTTQSLENSINAANAATQRYIAGSQVNSAATSNAVGDYDMRAVRGCYWGQDYYGRSGYVCP